MSTTTATRKSKKKDQGIPQVPLADKTIENLSLVMKMLADKGRLKMLLALAQEGEVNVSALCELVGQSQPAVSHHLTLMRMTGIVGYVRDGKTNRYYLDSEFLRELLEKLFRESGNSEQQIDLKDFSLSFEPNS